MYLDEYFKYKLDFNPKIFFGINTCSIITYIFLLLLVIYIYKTPNEKKIKIILIMISITFLILFIINQRMLTNKNLTKKYIKPKTLSKSLNTGDIVLFKSYTLDSIGQPLLYAVLTIQEVYFNHVGIIYKKSDGEIFLIESCFKEHDCKLSNIKKNGFVMSKFVDRIKNFDYNRIHVYKSNLHKYIDIQKLDNSIAKYKDYSYLHNNIHCISLVTNIFQENGLMKQNNNIIPYLVYDIIKPENYLIPIKFEEPIIVKDV